MEGVGTGPYTMRMRISFSLRLIFLMMLSSPMVSEGIGERERHLAWNVGPGAQRRKLVRASAVADYNIDKKPNRPVFAKTGFVGLTKTGRFEFENSNIGEILIYKICKKSRTQDRNLRENGLQKY
jgi:hypothetical protein